MPPRACDFCGVEYDYTRDHSRFHSGACKVAYWRERQGVSPPWTLECVVCGESFEAHRRDALYDTKACKAKAYRQRRESGTARTQVP